MNDFTLTTYKLLLTALQSSGYSFQAVEDFIRTPKNKNTILRHDVDRLPANALRMAKLEHESEIAATYYFRTLSESWDEVIIRQIADLGHEVGYHYEDFSLCRGNYELSIINFKLSLERFRKICPVKTICMHGSPFSKYDNKKIWEKYDYRDYGIIADCYLDVDFDEVFYITDTGRSWNNSSASVRDKVNSKFDIKIKDTNDLIEKIQNDELPDKIMINVHPQRWNDAFVPWCSELVRQNIKNVIKRWVIRREEFRSQNPGARR